ncbi:hypothetical protein BDV96DRAFT_297037 [Lophiotrema nucula]|uniref:Uncharacterized protein n=1 Tax=Lophiotrema nucula TaxID=690887 RepID=A0A6A5YMX4_9PLEO|nr:hypothetical protein BDV96DRAFT_297037 [Lophiotrema nucula]
MDPTCDNWGLLYFSTRGLQSRATPSISTDLGHTTSPAQRQACRVGARISLLGNIENSEHQTQHHGSRLGETASCQDNGRTRGNKNRRQVPNGQHTCMNRGLPVFARPTVSPPCFNGRPSSGSRSQLIYLLPHGVRPRRIFLQPTMRRRVTSLADVFLLSVPSLKGASLRACRLRLAGLP